MRKVCGVKDWGERISIDPNVCHGKSCIRGSRIMVWIVVDCLANGDPADEIVAAYPSLTREDIQAALAYAAEMNRHRYIDIPIARTS